MVEVIYMVPPRIQLFSAEEYTNRVNQVRELMALAGLDVLVIHCPENIYYLSGYQTPGYYWYQALILPLDSAPVFIAPPHEASLVPEFCWVEDVRLYPDISDWAKVTAEILKEKGFERANIGLETKSWFLTVDFHDHIKVYLPDSCVKSGSGIVESRRLIKSPRELEYLKQAAEISGLGMQTGINAVRAGATELEIAAAIHGELDLAGSEYTGLPAFITSGERSQLVHATWSSRRVCQGELVFMEIPGSVNRYHAAHSRSAFVGDPSKKALEASEVAVTALETAKSHMREGVPANKVFQAGRSVIDGADIGYKQGRRIAYGIGIAFPPGWDEGHIFSINVDESRPLMSGMCFHLITTMRIPGLGAIGCSDTVLVTKHGVETLTTAVEPYIQYG
ncbi:MAG: Xaa-Pro peptidase family protein [bacterium]|nr:Xaa-Pro peptidase family protein [bacterium]